MEEQKPKIVFYKRRQMGEKLNAAIDFMKENWRVLFKMSMYIIVPLALLQGLSYSRSITQIIGDSLFESQDPSLGEAFINLLSAIGGLYLSAIVYTLMKRYNEREERLQGVTFAEIAPEVNKGAGRLILFGFSASILFLGVIFIMFIFGGLFPGTIYFFIFLLLVFLFVVCIPLLLFPAVYLFEKDITLINAWKQTYRLGFATWGGTFTLALISMILICVCSFIVALPLIILTVVQSVFSLSTSGDSYALSVGYKLLQYLLSVIVAFFVCVTTVFYYIVMSYQYAHAREVMDHVTLESDIDRFDNLGSSND